MVERNRIVSTLAHVIAVLGALVTLFPLVYATIAATHPLDEVMFLPMDILPGDQLLVNLSRAWSEMNLGRAIGNSLIVALSNAVGTVLIAMMAAFAIVYFRLRFGMLAFWLIFCSMMVPVEVRIVPTYEVASDLLTPIRALLALVGVPLEARLSVLNSYTGLVLPILASATCTFFFRQFMLTLPAELTEAALIDGAGPVRFFVDHVLPLSKTVMAAMFLTQFVSGWNQYLWPLLVTTQERFEVVSVTLARMLPTPDEGVPEWNVTMAGTLMVMIPPILIVLFMQRHFVRGLVAPEK